MRLYKILIIAFFSAVFLSGCFIEEKPANGKPFILTTTNIIADIVSNVGGEFVVVRPLMSAGVDPHTYKASEGDIIRLAGADAVFYNGLNLEGKLGDVLDRINRKIPSYAISRDIPADLIIYHDSEPDPHIWFDPNIWLYAVGTVADALIELDPENSLYYRKNEELYVQQLLMLYGTTKEELDGVAEEQRVLVTSHDAFSYFGRAYGWEVIGIQGINTMGETSVHNIQNLAKIIVDKDIGCIFTETSVSSRSVEALIDSVNARGKVLNKGEALYSDSLGDRNSGADTYIKMLNTNIKNIVTCAEGIKNDGQP